MLPGFSGSLVTEYFAEEFLAATFGEEMDVAGASAARARLLRERDAVAARLGPVCGARQVFDLVAEPLAAALGYHPSTVGAAARGTALVAVLDTTTDCPLLFTTAWGEQLEAHSREASRAAIAHSVPWCLCVNGQHLRLLDARRFYARRHLQFDLEAALDAPESFSVLWALLRSESFRTRFVAGAASVAPLILRVIDASDRNTVAVCRSLRDGVLAALAQLLAGFLQSTRALRHPAPPRLASVHQQALTIIYRVLFLLFAESRCLVPSWHPVYRDGYSLEAVRALAERQGPAAGLWETLQAISRLSHAGCRAGDLRVTPFNGRLFSPAVTPLAEQGRLDDETARQMVLALSTTPRPGGRARIVYRDLDVEQLGAVYESVLDYMPVLHPAGGRAGAVPAVTLAQEGGVRKATATFYTPRALTTYLVRRTLAPLVTDATPEQILSLRVLDPAMGSGAFLVAACRFLAGEYAAALVRAGRCLPGDLDEGDRRGFRRAVAQRCLYGVDLNPMAVQLARLSLWLATLAPDRPLSFLDHRLLVGDSLVGASADDAFRRPAPAGGKRRRRAESEELPLFGAESIGPALRAVLPTREAMAERPDDTIGDVREKERLLSGVSGARSPLAGWKTVLDLWCSQASRPAGSAASAGLFAALADHVLTGRSSLAPGAANGCLEGMRKALDGWRPFHWTLEFPEVFYGAEGAPLDRPGFDAVIGNPPWDMLRADNPGADVARAREDAAGLVRFTRNSGIYRAQGEGHVNRFQLFVERAFHLARNGGRVGLVLPWGVLSDHGCAGLRRLLFDRTAMDAVVGFDNADRIFPIHRSVRFVALSATSGGATAGLRARLGERDTAFLDQLPAEGGDSSHFPLALSRGLLERLSGAALAVPDVRRPEDLALLEKLSRSALPLYDASAWGVEFGRELNATDDSVHFVRGHNGLPVLEGKHVEPFRALPGGATRRIPLEAARRLLSGERTFRRARLAYRDVSSATNRLTLIAAIVPAACVTVHSLFCLRTPLPLRAQLFLCGILNSLVANYLVRFWVSSHVTTSIVGRLPVPRPDPTSPAFRRIAALASVLSRTNDPLGHPAYPVLQAAVARLYGVTGEELDQVLASFPLIDKGVKDRIAGAFRQSTGRQPTGE